MDVEKNNNGVKLESANRKQSNGQKETVDQKELDRTANVG